MGSSEESSGVGEDVSPFSHPPIGALPSIADNAALYRAGASDEPVRGVGKEANDDRSSSGMEPWAYRSYPETDPFPTQQRLLGYFLRLREVQRDPDDPVCDGRIVRLRVASNAYEEERSTAWNPQLSTGERSVSSASIGRSEGSSSAPTPPLEGRTSTPAPPGGENWEKRLNDGIPNSHDCLDMFRLVPIGVFPLPSRGVPRWILYILNIEIYFTWFSSVGAADIRNLMNFDELHALMWREHRIGICQWRELVIRRLRSIFSGGGFPHDFESTVLNSELRGLNPDIPLPGL